MLKTQFDKTSGSSVCGVTTPSSTNVDDLVWIDGDGHTVPSVPEPGRIYTIRSVSCKRVITLLDGQVEFVHPGGRGCADWLCIETKGWLGFRNVASGKLMGHDLDGKLRCCVDWHRAWENFCIRPRPDGGYSLLMTNWDALWYVGVKEERGTEKLAKLGEGASAGTAWEFIEVHETVSARQ